ncbi:hypothetical protein Peur_040842 [Populus x canadensis]
MEFIPRTTIYLITLLSFSMPFATSTTIFDFENCEFPAIFNFGDSNSDTGGLAASFTPPPPLTFPMERHTLTCQQGDTVMEGLL